MKFVILSAVERCKNFSTALDMKDIEKYADKYI